MTTTKFNTTKEWFDIEREFAKFWNGFGYGTEQKKSNENSVWSPASDISENKENFYLLIDLPGIEKEDVKINFNDGELIISGERKEEEKEEGKTYHRVERSFGKYSRAFRLPDEIIVEKIIADFKNGQLKITIPKAEKAKPKEIEIKVN